MSRVFQASLSPIDAIKSRIKSPRSIIGKLKRRGFPITLQSMIDNLNDIGGIRVICPFIEDIYTVADMLMRQDDLTLIEKKGLHCQSQAERLPQPASDPRGAGFSSRNARSRYASSCRFARWRWISGPAWSTSCAYKSDVEIPEHMSDDLKKCADVIAETDQEMQRIAKELKVL